MLFKPRLTSLLKATLDRQLLCSFLTSESELARMSTNNHVKQNHDDEVDHSIGPGLLKIIENNPKRLKRIKFLGKLFQSHGFELRIAGGAVRDILRGKEPQDIDFATTARPEQSLAIVNKHEDLLRIIVTAAGQRHGTVAVKFKEVEIDFKRIKLDRSVLESQVSSSPKEPVYDDESPYEITTLRCDKLTDGRHAEVEFIKSWRVDAERRDLTINAMFLTLDDGRLVDYFHGERDLSNGIVRFVGDADQRIKEDYLRILRYFRFWSRYGSHKQPDANTLKTLELNLEGLKQISGERIWQEIKKTFSHLPCVEVARLMLKLRLFDQIGIQEFHQESYDTYSKQVLDELLIVQGNVQKFSQQTLEPGLKNNSKDQDLRKLSELVPVILFASVIRNKECCLRVCERVRFSKLERDTILNIIDKRFEDVSVEEIKYQLVKTSSQDRRQVLTKVKAVLVHKGNFELIHHLDAWKVPTFPISGHIVARLVKENSLPKKTTEQVLEALKLFWAKNDYSLTEEQLTNRLKTQVNELVETNKKCQ